MVAFVKNKTKQNPSSRSLSRNKAGSWHRASVLNPATPLLARHHTVITWSLSIYWASQVVKNQLVKNLPAMQETWVWSLGWEDPLEKGTATRSSILAWRIPWTIQSMGSQRIRHDWATFTFTLSISYNWYTGQHFDAPWACLPFAFVKSRRIYGDTAQFKCGFPLNSVRFRLSVVFDFLPFH